MRTCGSCHECCVHVKVEAFNKPADTPCQHLDVLQPCGACGIYNQRPSECRQYTCAWLDGFLTDGLKPEVSGILLEVCKIDFPKPLTLAIGFEHREGAVDRVFEQLEQSIVSGVLIGIKRYKRTDMTFFCQMDDFLAYETFMESCRRKGGITHVMADGTYEQRF